jgi:hypothetical protein
MGLEGPSSEQAGSPAEARATEMTNGARWDVTTAFMVPPGSESDSSVSSGFAPDYSARVSTDFGECGVGEPFTKTSDGLHENGGYAIPCRTENDWRTTIERSISSFYGTSMGDVFVGLLFGIAFFMFARSLG